MNILGISCFYHDSSVTLIQDGQISFSLQEERFSRIKNDKSFPFNSIKYILKKKNLELKNIDHIVFYENPKKKFFRIIKNIFNTLPEGFFYHLKVLNDWILSKFFYENLILKNLKKIDSTFDGKIKFIDHHISHASSAFFPSNFDSSVIINLDGVGEFATTTIGTGDGNKLKLDISINFPHSLGLIYSAFTYYLGFKVNSGEYKVMGLAPYGKPVYKEIIFDKLININDDESFNLNMKYFSFHLKDEMINDNFIKLFNNPRRSPEDNIEYFHMDMAASIQSVIEDTIIKIVKKAKKKYPNYKNLCLAGGVALNCVANGKIERIKIFDNIWVQPAAGDAGGSLGAALYFWYNILNKPRNHNYNLMKNSYLGTYFSNEEIKKTLENKNGIFHYHEDSEIFKIIAKKISEGSTVGWFQDRMEFGPRALGNRSILADPTSYEMQKNLNLKIKFRESFRPFAPAVLKEFLNDWFDINTESSYMSLVTKVKDEHLSNINKLNKTKGFEKLTVKYSKIPAVTHVDCSARVQTVKIEDNPKFYNLIKEFYKITGVPILINTSFNVRGEPIVSTPNDAFNCFMMTDLDIMVCGNYILYKAEQIHKEKYTNNFIEKFNNKYKVNKCLKN